VKPRHGQSHVSAGDVRWIRDTTRESSTTSGIYSGCALRTAHRGDWQAGKPDTSPRRHIIGPGTEMSSPVEGPASCPRPRPFHSPHHFNRAPQQNGGRAPFRCDHLFGRTGSGAWHASHRTCTPGHGILGRMLQAMDGVVLQLGLAGQGNAASPVR